MTLFVGQTTASLQAPSLAALLDLNQSIFPARKLELPVLGVWIHAEICRRIEQTGRRGCGNTIACITW
jgi:hypothetical protein